MRSVIMGRLHYGRYSSDVRLTHYLFRFPAKFHPPVVRCLLDRYSAQGDRILDPFCGSGTVLVEALISGRDAVGIDIDPLAAFISRVKSRPIDPCRLESDFERLTSIISGIRRSPSEYGRLMFNDLTSPTLGRWRHRLEVPDIPNLTHWFRNYVTVDLARLRDAILKGSFRATTRDFFLACFAAIIRNASNADPVPVSGLEVTAHMRRLDAAGRRIDPFELFERRARREIAGMRQLWERAQDSSIRVRRGDATTLRSTLSSGDFDAVITSPPYNTAVDYYRRHMLEMYWLGLIDSHEERLALAPYYVGRSHVREDHHRASANFKSDYVNRLVAHAKRISSARERAVVHYCASMQRALGQIAEALKPSGQAIFVVGNSKWNGRRTRATHLLVELATPRFEVTDMLSYATRNRYMSYERHNGANVNWEYVVVLRKKKAFRARATNTRRLRGQASQRSLT